MLLEAPSGFRDGNLTLKSSDDWEENQESLVSKSSKQPKIPACLGRGDNAKEIFQNIRNDKPQVLKTREILIEDALRFCKVQWVTTEPICFIWLKDVIRSRISVMRWQSASFLATWFPCAELAARATESSAFVLGI